MKKLDRDAENPISNADFIVPVEIDGTIHQATGKGHTAATYGGFSGKGVSHAGHSSPILSLLRHVLQ
ncbi:hypothetical protein QTO34_007282 [Cnephaeus nilssonii]|uniref:Uncharacterized protein n=1 Tax=Cnephaeus nilssonii TaxID=3371016 RepID=A0AA40HK12_CNENI|nr:hypothetical protein QTO34_007282 [Eptesicus nilssonii]